MPEIVQPYFTDPGYGQDRYEIAMVSVVGIQNCAFGRLKDQFVGDVGLPFESS